MNQVLSDKERRETYDRYGEEGLKDGARSAPDVFSSFFGDFFGTNDNRPRDTPRGANVVVPLYVTLEELYNGDFVEILRKRPIYKPAPGKLNCDFQIKSLILLSLILFVLLGTRKCNCRNEMVTRSLGELILLKKKKQIFTKFHSIGPGRYQVMQQQVCDDCENLEIATEERILEIEIERGIRDGHEQRFSELGEPHIDGLPGDLVIKFMQQPHKTFERKGDDLYTNVTISLTDALTGFETNIKHLDGHLVSIKRDKITWPGSKMRKPNEGMINYENNKKIGTLFITFDVDFPKGWLLIYSNSFISLNL